MPQPLETARTPPPSPGGTHARRDPRSVRKATATGLLLFVVFNLNARAIVSRDSRIIELTERRLVVPVNAANELALLASTRSAVLVLFRTLLRIHGDATTGGAAEVVRRATGHAGIDPAPFLAVLTHVDRSSPIPAARADAVLTAYHSGFTSGLGSGSSSFVAR